jgi:hypothetical protein
MHQGIKRLVLVIVSTCVGFSLLEAGLWAKRGAPGRGAHHRVFCDYDAELGWRLTPNKRALRERTEYKHIETVNSLGMRDVERAVANPAGATRVLVLGDSFVEGYSVADDETLTRKLEAHLANNGRAVEVLNAGVGGYSTDQELIWFRKRGRFFKPDIVVLALYRNDILFNPRPAYSRGPKPHFRIDEDGLVEPPERAGPKPVPLVVKGWHRWTAELSGVSHTYGYLRMKWWNLKWRVRQWRDGKSTEPITLDARPERAEVTAAWHVTELLLQQLRVEVEAVGARFVVLWVPAIELVHPDDDGGYGEDVVGARLAKIATRRGITLISPLTELRRAQSKLAEQGERVYYESDRHWTRHGHQVAAEVLAERLDIGR